MQSPCRPSAPLLAAAAFTFFIAGAGAAFAQPVSFQLKNDVAAGQKPTLSLMAIEKVAGIQVDLQRDDGEKFTLKHPGLAPGKSVVFTVGDGKPGKAHYRGKLELQIVGAGPWSYDLEFDTLIRGTLSVTYDFEHLDLAGRVLRFQLSRPAGKADLVVIGEDGEEMGQGTAVFNKEPPGTWLPIAWTEARPGRVMMMKLHAVAADGLGVHVELIPWSVVIEHEDVKFDTDSAVIKPGEAGKLDASLEKIHEAVRRAERFVKVKLYVAGHTDTVGSKEHNHELSHARARAIAEYFRKKGLAIPILYEGFGEEVPKVQTPDNTDEVRNRRTDYVIGAANAAPPFSGPYKNVKANWQALK